VILRLVDGEVLVGDDVAGLPVGQLAVLELDQAEEERVVLGVEAAGRAGVVVERLAVGGGEPLGVDALVGLVGWLVLLARRPGDSGRNLAGWQLAREGP